MGKASRRHISFVIATHNRCPVLTETLGQLDRCGLDRGDYEIIVVDNASGDGTPEVVAAHCDIVVRLDRNAGSCAKAYGVDRAAGRYIIFLDDDSYPHPGSVADMIEHFEDDSKQGRAGP